MNIRHIALALACSFSLWATAQNQFDFSTRKGCMKAVEEAENTLGNPTSDQHDEKAYLEVLQKVTGSHLLKGDEQLRPQMLLEAALKNKIGEKAADISFVTKEGKDSSLYKIGSPFTLVYFNDPDCESCVIVKERLDTCQLLRKMVENKQLTILAIYTSDNEISWKKSECPDYIIDGWNKSLDIEELETYNLPTIPLFYLVDNQKNVMIKNEASLNHILEALKKL